VLKRKNTDIDKGRQKMNAHGRFSRILHPLIIVSAGILATLLLTGCPDFDYGESDACVCANDPILVLAPPYGTPITSIKKEWSPLLIGYPGQIIVSEVSGGDDRDYVFNTAVDPLDGCGGGCPPTQDCMDRFGNSSRVCVTNISNRNIPYLWDASGCVESIEPDPDTDTGLCDKCYVKLKKEYIETAAEFTVSVTRHGASQEELQCENFAYAEWKGVVLPPPQFTMSISTSPQTAILLLSGPDAEGSAWLREDKSQNPTVPQDTLKQRSSDPSDRSVGVDYRVHLQYTDPLAPVDYDSTNSLHFAAMRTLDLLGRDILISNHLYFTGIPAPPVGPVFSGVHGLAYEGYDFIILSSVEVVDVKQTFAHEIGHCCGLADNQPLVSHNLMLSGLGPSGFTYGMDVHSQFSQNLKLDDGSEDWHD